MVVVWFYGLLVLATVVWFWSQSSASYRSGASLGREDVRKGKKIKVVFRCTRGMQKARVEAYREYSRGPDGT